MDNKPYIAIIVSHTHWDRAWYVTFQEFRARLVRLIDRLIHLLEDELDFRVFMLDGQTVVLEDYLEVRPQNEARLKKLALEGRLQVGPWYVLPDEFLASPEALIRNLMLGHRMAAGYGGAMKVGYVPDGFGHIAQLPQVFRGFGFDSAVLWRGMGEAGERLGTEFHWVAPNGSSVLAIWMAQGYHNVSNLGYAVHWGDVSQMEFDGALAQAKIEKAITEASARANIHGLLLMNGIDHAEAEPRIPEIIYQANLVLPEATIRHGTLLDHLRNVRESEGQLPTYRGELRWGRYDEILQGVYTTRIYLKQANQRIENLLERYAEPLVALAALVGGGQEGASDLLWTAWRWLLKNHPHDDIYGSGIDSVHEEMMYRFAQAEQIGQVLVRDSLRVLGRHVDFTSQEGMPLLVHNPLNWRRKEVVTGTIDFDFDEPLARGLKDQKSGADLPIPFAIVDNRGQAVPFQILEEKDTFLMEVLKANRKRCVKVSLLVDEPPCGYRTYYVQPRRQDAAVPGTDLQVLSDGTENEFVRLTIAPDGTLSVLDKATGATYSGLNAFADVEDAGDEYSYSPCAESQTVISHGGQAQVQLVVSGPVQVSYEVRLILDVPRALSPDRSRRSQERVSLPITSWVTLYAGMPGVYISTEVDNRARDHKLQALFPTGLSPAFSHADGHFAVLEREIDLPQVEGWKEDPSSLMHQRAFADLSEGGRGLAVLNRGLPAYEVLRQGPGTTIALTLLRCVGWLSRDDLLTRRGPAGPMVETPGAQCPGVHRFEYAILPHAGDWREVYSLAYAFVAPLLLARGDTHEGLLLKEMNITGDDPSVVKALPFPRGGDLPDELSFVTVEPASLVVSALKRAADGYGLVVRFYNLAAGAVTGKVGLFRPIARAYRVNLNEERQADLPVGLDGRLELAVDSHEVVSVEIIPA